MSGTIQLSRKCPALLKSLPQGKQGTRASPQPLVMEDDKDLLRLPDEISEDDEHEDRSVVAHPCKASYDSDSSTLSDPADIKPFFSTKHNQNSLYGRPPPTRNKTGFSMKRPAATYGSKPKFDAKRSRTLTSKSTLTLEVHSPVRKLDNRSTEKDLQCASEKQCPSPKFDNDGWKPSQLHIPAPIHVPPIPPKSIKSQAVLEVPEALSSDPTCQTPERPGQKPQHNKKPRHNSTQSSPERSNTIAFRQMSTKDQRLNRRLRQKLLEFETREERDKRTLLLESPTLLPRLHTTPENGDTLNRALLEEPVDDDIWLLSVKGSQGERCPLCDEPVDRELYESYTTKSGFPLSLRLQQEFCEAHLTISARQAYKEAKYPATIDWDGLPDRLARLSPTVVRSLLSNKGHVADSSPYLASYEKKVRSGTNNHSVRGALESTAAVAGYYGGRGARVVLENVMQTFREDIRKWAVKNELVSVRGNMAFVQAVVVPELISRLIMEDMGVNQSRACAIMSESEKLGRLLNAEVGDVVEGSEDEEEDGNLSVV